MGKPHDNFDYEEAEMDIWDAGGDPDKPDPDLHIEQIVGNTDGPEQFHSN